MKVLRALAFIGALVGATLIGQEVIAAQNLQLIDIGDSLIREGYWTSHETQNGSLRQSQSRTFSFWLQQGTEYTFRGTCDADCSDLDLEITNQNGVIVDSDFAPNDVPAVRVRPRRSGYYDVRVMMYSCSIEPCDYAVGTFSR